MFSGAEQAFIPMEHPEVPPFHGYDGFGDLEWKTQPNLSVVQSQRAAIEMQRLVLKVWNYQILYDLKVKTTYQQHPKQITFICCGPLSNVALAIKLYPNFGENIKEVHIMGGNYEAVGNTSTRCAEFNFYIDTEAAHIVFNSLKCPITLLPWESLRTPIELVYSPKK